MFAGYFHDMNNSFNDKNSVYALNDGWTGSAWTYTYGYIMTAAQKSEKINQEQKGLLGVTKILKVELTHRIADTYGPIVYTNSDRKRVIMSIVRKPLTVSSSKIWTKESN